MLVIYQKASNHVPLMIVSIEDGTPLKRFTQLLHRNRKVDFIEQFNEKLLVKQDKENLQIIDVRCYYFVYLMQQHLCLNFELKLFSSNEF